MSEDIATRLREWARGAEEQKVDEVACGLCLAADEIERLRAELASKTDELERLRERCTMLVEASCEDARKKEHDDGKAKAKHAVQRGSPSRLHDRNA